MKKCPFCGADIEDSARFCLYCMQSLGEKDLILPLRKKKPQWLLIIAAIAIVSAMLTFLLSVMLSASKNGPAQESRHLGSSSTSPEASSSGPLPTTTAPRPTTLPVTPTAPPSTTPAATQPTEPDPSLPTEPHEHSFTVRNAISKYLKSEADCDSPPAYYYSCFCGAKGTQTFYWGEAKGCNIVVEPGYPPTCTATGLTERKHCTVCGTVFQPHMEIAVLGHSYALGDATKTCLNCGTIGTTTIITPDFPYIWRNAVRIDSGTYRITPIAGGKWHIAFTFYGTNITSESVLFNVDASLWGVTALSCVECRYLKPYESNVNLVRNQLQNIDGTFTLVLE